MTLDEFVRKWKVLVNCVAWGSLYTFLYWLGWNAKEAIGFLFLLLILPGMIFPASTSYKASYIKRFSFLLKSFHFLLSVGLYILIVQHTLRSAFDYTSLMIYGFTGSYLYLLMTKWLLKFPIPYGLVICTAVISGVTMLLAPTGLSFFLWTVVNGFSINYSIIKTPPPARDSSGSFQDENL